MNKRQKMICVIALHRNGYNFTEIAQALGVDKQRAQDLKYKGAAAMSSGKIGYIQVSRISVDTTRPLDSTAGSDFDPPPRNLIHLPFRIFTKWLNF